MKRSTKVKWGEIKVGILISIAIFVLLWASFSGSGTSIFEKKASYIAYFDNVSGLVKGAPVWIAGVEVGNVKSIKFVNLDSAGQIEIKLRVKESVTNMITVDARIRIGTIGMLGDKYVEIIPGTLGRQLIAEDGAIRTDATGDLAALMSEGEELVSSTRKVMGNLCDITGQIKDGEGTLGQLISNKQLHAELTSLVTTMTVLMDVNDDELYQEIKNLVARINNLVTDIEQNPHKYLKFSVF